MSPRRRKPSPFRLIGLLAVTGLAGCAILAPPYTRPTLSVVGIEMVGGNFLQQNFRVTFKIQNPNDRNLPVSGLHAELHVAGETMASGVSDRAFTVPRFGETQFDMRVTANLATGLIKLANQMNRNTGAIDYELTGAVSIDLPLMRELAFHQSGSFTPGQ